MNRPALRAVEPPAVPDAPSPERKLLRTIQQAVSAFGGTEPPTPRERAAIRAQLHSAVDVYLVDKLADANERQRQQQRSVEEVIPTMRK